MAHGVRPRGVPQRHGRRNARAQGLDRRKRTITFGVVALVIVSIVAFLAWSAIRGTPVLAFDKMRAYLGDVPRNQEGTQSFLVLNNGRAPLTVGPVRVQVDQGCDQVTISKDSFHVAPGEAAQLTVNFGRHQKLGPHRVVVSVPSTDPDRPSAELLVSFEVIEEESYEENGPRLRLDKELVDIGIVPYDWPLYEKFTLHNDGNEPLVLGRTPQVRVEEGC